MTFNSLYTLPGQHLLLLCALVVIHRASSGFLQSLVTRLFERFFQVPPIPSLVMLHLQSQAFCRAPSQTYCPTNPQNSWCCNLKAIFLLTMSFGLACHLPCARMASLNPLKETLKTPFFLHNSKVIWCLQTAVISKWLIRFEWTWWQMKDFMPAQRTLSTKKWLRDCSFNNFEGWLGNMSDKEPYRMFLIANLASPKKK